MKRQQIKLSIIIPARDEGENFHKGTLNQVLTYLQKQNYNYEVLFMIGGCTDGGLTVKLLTDFSKRHPGFKAIDVVKGGKAPAIREGVKRSQGEFILFTDFDQSTSINYLDQVFKEFEKGADMVITQRKDIMGWSSVQKLRHDIFNLIAQIILVPGVSDTQNGFKAFKKNVARNLFNSLQVTKKYTKGGYMGAFDIELIFIARKKGYQVASLPVKWQYHASGRLSWTHPFKILKEVFEIRFLDIIGRYG